MIIKYNNKVVTHNNKWVGYESSEPLPAYTLRLRFSEGYTPTFSKGTGVQVSSSPNIWDLTYNNTNWGSLLSNQSDLLEVLGANTSNVTQMGAMFYLCTSLTSVALFDTSNVSNMNSTFSNCTSLITVPLFDTSNVTDMWGMFLSCSSLTSVPLFNTSNVTDMRSVFRECRNVQSGALALYQQASTQANPPSDHSLTFRNCGTNTQTGAAELVQIPDDWK